MEELLKGWLSPTGEFIETELYEHISKAKEILAKVNYKNSPDDELLSRGWVSITWLNFLDHGWSITWKKELTPEQEKFLKQYYEGQSPVTKDSLYKWNCLHSYMDIEEG